MKSIYDLTLEQLKEELKAMGQKPFRAKQIYEWIYVKNVYDFHQMTNLSKELQETLSNHFSDALLTIRKSRSHAMVRLNIFLNQKMEDSLKQY